MKRVPLAFTCHESWERMPGGTSQRACARCEQRVFDLSARTELEARAILTLLAADGLCMRYQTGLDDELLFRRPPSAAPTSSDRVLRAAALAALSLAASTGCGPAPSRLTASAPTGAVSAAPVAPSGAQEPGPAVPDADRDGLLDKNDVCPNDAEDRDGFEDEDGCPDPDDDKDGVLDVNDACPREPGMPGGEHPGCRPTFVGLVVSPDEITFQSSQVHFPRGSAHLRPESLPIIDAVASVLRDMPELRKLRIDGNASNDEPRAAKLALARAQTVLDALVARGVAASRLEIRGWGIDRPVAGNHTAEGRALNRRVGFQVLERSGGREPRAGSE